MTLPAWSGRQSHGRFENPIADSGATLATYWFFVIMLAFNAIYPGALYYSRRQSSSAPA